MGLRNKDLISIHDLSVGEVATILDVAKKLKRKQKRGEPACIDPKWCDVGRDPCQGNLREKF